MRQPLFFDIRILLEFASFGSAFYGYGYSYGCANHGVVAHAEEAHHFYVSRYGRRASELCIAVHTAHGIGHAVRSRAGSHVVRMECTACAAAGCNGEVFLAHFDTFFLICTGNGVLEAGRVGRVARNGDVDAFVVHDSDAFADIVGTEAADIGPFALGIRDFTDDVQFTRFVIELGLNIGEAVDTGN